MNYKSYFLNKGVLKFLFLILFVNASNFYAVDYRDTLKVLFVGNSYTYFNNLAQTVSAISDSTGIKIIADPSTYPGAALSDHYHGRYNIKSVDKIKNGHYDAVVLQDFSMAGVLTPDSLDKYAALMADIVKQSGAKVYYYETWARLKVPQYQEDIKTAYKSASEKNTGVVVHCGSAWDLARKEYPEVKLFRDDGSHPMPLGTLLNALMFVKEFTGELPKDIPNDIFTKDNRGNPLYLMSVDPLEEEFCKRIVAKMYEK